MQGSSNNSFIPKRGTSKRKQGGGVRQIFIFTYVSYILMFAALLSSAGIFLYTQLVAGQLDTEIEALNSEISSFSQADMQRVTQFDLRLSQAKDRLDNSVSVASVFEALQSATIDTVQLETLTMSRQGDEKFSIDAAVQTDSFDSTIFQREVFLRNESIQNVDISDVQSLIETGEIASTQGAEIKPVVTFKALLEIPLSDVPANPESYKPVEIQEVEVDETLSVEDNQEEAVAQDSNENTI
jgi:hypothetical protein